MFPLPEFYPSDREAKILLRGGAKIELQKCFDRFTVGLAYPIADLAQWAERLGSKLDRELPSIGQIALRVESDRLEGVMAKVRRSAEVAFASHAYCLAEAEPKGAELNFDPTGKIQNIFYLTDQIALQFQPHITAQQIEAITRAVGLKVLKLIPGIPKAFVYRLGQGAIVNPLKLANRLIHHPDILLAEPNVAAFAADLTGDRIDPQQASRSEPFFMQRSQANSAVSSSWAGTRGIPAAGTRSTVVAVIDPIIDRSSSASNTAIDLSQPAFAGMGKIVAPLNLSASTAAVSHLESPAPALSWGTICAQTAVGEVSEKSDAIAGIAPGCSLMPISINSLIDDSAIEQIFEWGVRQGAAVMSGRIPDSLLPSLRQRSAIQRAATQGRNGKGCVVLVRDRSAWANLPDVLPIAIDPDHNHQAEAVVIGVRAGIAARVLSVNPDLTARQVQQILRALEDQSGNRADPSSIPVAVELAVGLAMRYGVQFPEVDRLSGAGRQPLEQVDRSPLPIPDGDDRGIIRTVAIQQPGVIRNVEVSVAIDHPFLGDLKIWLLPPVGDAILLQDRMLGRMTQLNICYGLGTTPHLKSLLGRSAQGLWQLQVCDAIPGHAGVLQEWQLRLSVE